MQRWLGRVGIVVALVVGVGLGAVVRIEPQPESVASAAPALAGNCSNANLNGPYGIKFDGTSASLGKFASVSLWSFDGKGGFTASETYNSDGTGPATRSIVGTYVVQSNCTFTLSFDSTLAKKHEAVGACVLMDNAKEFACLDVEAGWVATSVGKRI